MYFLYDTFLNNKDTDRLKVKDRERYYTQIVDFCITGIFVLLSDKEAVLQGNERLFKITKGQFIMKL